MNRRIIENAVGYWNPDVQSGWKAGMSRKKHIPLDLLSDDAQSLKRYTDWIAGRDAAIHYQLRNGKSCHFVGTTPEGKEVIIRRKGTPSRGPIINRMEQMGVYGDVYVYYFVGSTPVRKVKCGI